MIVCYSYGSATVMWHSVRYLHLFIYCCWGWFSFSSTWDSVLRKHFWWLSDHLEGLSLDPQIPLDIDLKRYFKNEYLWEVISQAVLRIPKATHRDTWVKLWEPHNSVLELTMQCWWYIPGATPGAERTASLYFC